MTEFSDLVFNIEMEGVLREKRFILYSKNCIFFNLLLGRKKVVHRNN